MYSPVFNNSNFGFSTQNGDFAEDSIRKFSDLSHTEGNISYPNFLANKGCINRRDYFKPTFKNSNAAKKRDSKVLPGKPNHMTSVIQNLQNVSGVFEMTDSTASTTIKNTEKIQVGVSPKVLSATISTQPS